MPCEVEIIYSLALAGGGTPCKSSRSRASVGLGKKTRLDSSSTLKRRKEEVFLTVSTAKNLEGTQYKVIDLLASFVVIHRTDSYKLQP